MAFKKEVWESKKGVFIETDAETNAVKWISVYSRELDNEDFENANRQIRHLNFRG